MGELAGFSIQQEASISVCEARKDAAVAIIDAVNAAQPKRKKWWSPW